MTKTKTIKNRLKVPNCNKNIQNELNDYVLLKSKMNLDI